jgi:hypothetical protein
MDHSDDWLRRLNPPRRNHFFTGKMMGVAQFEREQRYGMGERWLLNRLTLGTGILCGLEVTVSADGKYIRLEPGVAVDPWGREIIVARAVPQYDPFKAGGDGGCGAGPAITAAGDYLLCLTYRECMTDEQPAAYGDDCQGQPECQPDTTVETFALGFRPAAGGPDGFDCTGWTANVLPPDAVAGDGGKPPTAAELRDRLLRQFGASCGKIPGDPCVPLGQVTASKNTDGTFTLSPGSKASRVQIYSQTQLLDLVLCLAGKVVECCKDGRPSEPTPTDTESLKVSDLVVGTLSPVNAVGEVASLHRLASTGPPRFVLPSSGFVVIGVSFTHETDTQTLVPAVDAASPRSVSLLMTDPAGGADVLIPLFALAVPLDPSVWLLFMMSGGGTTSVRNNFLFETGVGDTGGRGTGRPPSGVYTLTLSATDDPVSVPTGRRVAITSKAVPPAPALVLNGDYTGTFPSGDATPRGDFIYTFELVAPLDVTITADGNPVSENAPGTWAWTANDLTVLLDFTEDIDPATVAAGIEITITGTTMRVPPVVSVTGSKQVQAVLAVTQPDFAEPPVIEIKLPKSTLRAVDGRFFDRDASFRIDITA